MNATKVLISKLGLFCIICSNVVYCNLAFAQSMQVIGGGSIAQECFRASANAARTGIAGSRDLTACDNALQHGSLKRPDLIATYVNRGVINVALQNYRDAAKDYNKALRLDPDTAEAYLNRGNLWYIARRDDEAISDYDKSLEFDFPKAHVAFLNKGIVYESQGNLEQAKINYMAALERFEDWPSALKKLERVNEKIDK